MKKFLFLFGFASPPIWEALNDHGWDGEDNGAFFVWAENADDALSWGKEVAEHFVRYLFLEKWGKKVYPSWKEEQYAHWIVEDPAKEYSPESLKGLREVTFGQLPDFTGWE